MSKINTTRKELQVITLRPEEKLRKTERRSEVVQRLSGFPSNSWVPRVDIKESASQFVFIVELPGIEVRDLTVALSGNVLTISSTRTLDQGESEGEYMQIERGYGSFERSFILPTEVKADAIEGNIRNGLLLLTLRKKHGRPAVKIPISKA